jgi:hypothetical protein
LVQAVRAQLVVVIQGVAEQRQDLLTQPTAAVAVAELKKVATVQAAAAAAIEAALAQVFPAKVMQAARLVQQVKAAAAAAVAEA